MLLYLVDGQQGDLAAEVVEGYEPRAIDTGLQPLEATSGKRGRRRGGDRGVSGSGRLIDKNHERHPTEEGLAVGHIGARLRVSLVPMPQRLAVE